MVARVDVRGGIATVTFARPERRNSFDVSAIEELRDAVVRAASDPAARVLLLAAEGPAFVTGADVKDLAAHADEAPKVVRALATALHAIIDTLHRGPKPSVAAIGGDAAGGGFGLALSCDVRIASSEARFRAAYPRIGLTPDGGLTYFVARYAGLAEAQRILYLDPTLAAEEARAIGLVHEVVPPAKLAERAREAASTLAGWDAEAVARTKALLGHAWDRASAAQMEKELETLAAQAGTEAAREGLRAFAEKRAPRFK